jgi:hypothetical protein
MSFSFSGEMVGADTRKRKMKNICAVKNRFGPE